MAGNVLGGKKAAQTNKAKYGENYYKEIGSLGGKAKVPKGFALMDPKKLSEISGKGGRISRRGINKYNPDKVVEKTIVKSWLSRLLNKEILWTINRK
jgi:general stress protein YciG